MTASHTKEEADSLYKQSKFIEAINVYNRVIEHRNRETSVDSKKGDLHILHSNRCACHLQVGDVLKALEDANSCIRMSPGWSKGYNRKGSCLLRLSLTDEAILAYEKALELDSSNTEAINALIRLRGSATRPSATGTSTNSTAGTSQYSTILLNYWNDFTAAATRYSKDGFACLKSFLRQCYYSAIVWWFSLWDQTKNLITIGLFVLMLYWLLSPNIDSYRHDYVYHPRHAEPRVLPATVFPHHINPHQAEPRVIPATVFARHINPHNAVPRVIPATVFAHHIHPHHAEPGVIQARVIAHHTRLISNPGNGVASYRASHNSAVFVGNHYRGEAICRYGNHYTGMCQYTWYEVVNIR